MNKDAIEIAKMLKDRENNNGGFDSFITGVVVSATPNPKIQIEEGIFKEAEDLIFISTMSFEVTDEVVLIPSNETEMCLVLGKKVQY